MQALIVGGRHAGLLEVMSIWGRCGEVSGRGASRLAEEHDRGGLETIETQNTRGQEGRSARAPGMQPLPVHDWRCLAASVLSDGPQSSRGESYLCPHGRCVSACSRHPDHCASVSAVTAQHNASQSSSPTCTLHPATYLCFLLAPPSLFLSRVWLGISVLYSKTNRLSGEGRVEYDSNVIDIVLSQRATFRPTCRRERRSS